MQKGKTIKKRVYCKLNYHTFLQAVGLIRLGQANRFRTYKPKRTKRYSAIIDPRYCVLVFEYETKEAINTIFELVYLGQIMDWFIELGFDFYQIHLVYLSEMSLTDRELFNFSRDYYFAQMEKAKLLTELSEEDFCEEEPTRGL
ncbi:MAG: hypothetical protein ACXVCD_18790 [Pseudobdellovibrionaceae bacterium]